MATLHTADARASAYASLRGRDLLSIRDLTADELIALLDLAAAMKARPYHYDGTLTGAVIALLFEKPSLRTRVSFDVAAHHLGAHAIYLAPQEVGLGRRESASDVARTLEHMVDALIARTFSQATLEQLASATSAPVINALSDLSHPCQALADYLTVREAKQRLAGVRLAYVCDGNNVAHSLILAGALLGVSVAVASPEGHEPLTEVIAWAHAHATNAGATCRVTHDPIDAVLGADVIYTDTWISMGQEAEGDARRREFAGFEVTEQLLRHASPDAVFMHCLPAHRGEEVEARVIDARRSVVFQQAENRLHTEKALLVALLKGAAPEL